MGRLFAAVAAATLMLTAPAEAQIKVKVGVLTDMSGIAADIVGEGSVVAARMAVEDFAALDKSVQAEIVSADHQNNPDVGLSIARSWYDRDGVDAITDVPNSSIALALNTLTRQKNKVALMSSAGSSELSGAQCSPNTVQWVYDTWAQAHGLAKVITERGNKNWYFILPDYAFAKSMVRDATAVIDALGGTVVGTVVHPYGPSADLASFVLQAQASKADVIGLISPGDQFRSIYQQAVEFKVSQKLVGFSVFLPDIKALGPEVAQGLLVSEAFYWDQDDGTRAWSKRFADRMKGRPPTSLQAGVYGTVFHYLKAVSRAGSNDAGAVMAKMKEIPTDDPLFGKGAVRADGRVIHNMYLFEVKRPAEVKGEWDLYKLVATIPPEEAFRPLSEGGCPLVASK